MTGFGQPFDGLILEQVFNNFLFNHFTELHVFSVLYASLTPLHVTYYSPVHILSNIPFLYATDISVYFDNISLNSCFFFFWCVCFPTILHCHYTTKTNLFTSKLERLLQNIYRFSLNIAARKVLLISFLTLSTKLIVESFYRTCTYICWGKISLF